MMFTGRAVPGFMQGWSKRAYIRLEIQNQLADLRAPLGPTDFRLWCIRIAFWRNRPQRRARGILPDSLGFHEQTRIPEWLGLMQ